MNLNGWMDGREIFSSLYIIHHTQYAICREYTYTYTYFKCHETKKSKSNPTKEKKKKEKKEKKKESIYLSICTRFHNTYL